MRVFKLPNAAASKLTVTNSATTLASLVTTASGGTNPSLPSSLNAIFLVPEDGDIRVTFDENPPTSARGLLLRSGQYQTFVGVPLSKMRMIRTGGSNVAVSIVVGEDDVDCQE